MTQFDLLNLIGMFESDLKTTLDLVERDKKDKSIHRLKEMIHSCGRLREKYEMGISNR